MLRELGQMASLMWQLQKNAGPMAGKMQDMQQRLAQTSVTGEAGGGAVQVEFNGTGQCRGCQIAPALLTSGDSNLLQGLLIDAINQAQEKVRELAAREAGQLTEGLDLGAISDLLGHLPGRKG